MAAWTQPVFDRTQTDVELAKQYQAGKLTHVPLTMADQEFQAAEKPFWVWLTATLLKGFLNAEDLTRIEGNVAYVSDKLLKAGYLANVESKTEWKMKEFPWLDQLERVRRNVAFLADIYAKSPDAPELPEEMKHLDYRGINAIEKILYDLHHLLVQMENSYVYCGGFACGEV